MKNLTKTQSAQSNIAKTTKKRLPLWILVANFAAFFSSAQVSVVTQMEEQE